MVKKFIQILVMIFAICFSPALIFAQDIEVSAIVDSNRVTLGSTIQLTVTVTGNKDVEPVELPPIDGLKIQYIGPSTRVSVVNGKYSAFRSFVYMLFPLRAGSFQIPALSITIDGKVFTTDPITIEVIDNAKSALESSASDQSVVPSESSLKDKVFLFMSVPKKDFYVYEPIPLTIQLFLGGIPATDIDYPEFPQTGFGVEPFGKPSQYRKIMDGIEYTVVEYKTVIYPTRPGDLEMGPAQVACNLLFKSNTPDNSLVLGMGGGGFFDTDFLGGFRDQYFKQPITVESKPLALHVLDLPPAPDTFKGAVGNFELNTHVRPRDVSVGDPITVEIRIAGSGNLDSVTMPVLETTGFKAYDPEIREEGSAKIFEQVLIPTSEDLTEVPEIVFTNFNPDKGEYQTVRHGPFPIQVKPSAGPASIAASVNGRTDQAKSLDAMGRDLVFIKEKVGRLTSFDFLYNRPWFKFLIVLLVLCWGVTWSFYRRSHRLKTDTAYARRLHAPKQARQRLQQARAALAALDYQAFYDLLFKTMRDYLAGKYHAPAANVTKHSVAEILSKHKVPNEVVQDAEMVFQECDMVRYAGVQPDATAMKDALARVEAVIDQLERKKV